MGVNLVGPNWTGLDWTGKNPYSKGTRVVVDKAVNQKRILNLLLKIQDVFC